ncbi:unnamed protein product, partial [Scytosiphon promiscuus]
RSFSAFGVRRWRLAAFTAYGRDTRRKMVRSIFCRRQVRHAIRLLADKNLRHAAIARGEFTRNLTFNNLALLPAELTPVLGPVPTKALLVSWRYNGQDYEVRTREIDHVLGRP